MGDFPQRSFEEILACEVTILHLQKINIVSPLLMVLNHTKRMILLKAKYRYPFLCSQFEISSSESLYTPILTSLELIN
jgi:hypothetical protein